MVSSSEHVEVALSFQYQSPQEKYTERRIRLDHTQKRVQIGRTSKRDPNLAPATNNGWIDSPIISREHAELSVNTTDQGVYIKDHNSRHGTFLNHERLEPNRRYPLTEGDVLKFGIDIQRDEKTFPPPSAQVSIALGTYATPKPQIPPIRKAGFVVPDDSDSSDSSEEEDSAEIRSAVKVLREVAGTRHPRLDSEASQVVTQTAQVVDKLIKPPPVLIEIDEDDTVPSTTVNFVDLTGGTPAPEIPDSHQDDKSMPDVALSGGVSIEQNSSGPEESEAIPAVADKPRQQTDLEATEIQEPAQSQAEHAKVDSPVSEDEKGLDSDEDTSQSEEDDEEGLISEAYDSDDDLLLSSGLVVWEESQASSPSPKIAPLGSGALPDPVEEQKSSDEDLGEFDSDLESIDGLPSDFQSEVDSDDSDDMVITPSKIREDQHVDSTVATGDTSAQFPHRFEAVDTSFEPYVGAAPPVNSFALYGPGPSYLNFDQSMYSDAMYHQPSQALPIPNEPDYRLRLPSILNNPPQVASHLSMAPHSYVQCGFQSTFARATANMATAHGDVKASETVIVESGPSIPAPKTSIPDSSVPKTSIDAVKDVAPVVTHLVPQSPLIESGERFLSYPPEEPQGIPDRGSPELDMSSAWLFQQSKLNSGPKTKASALPLDKPVADFTGSSVKVQVSMSGDTDVEGSHQDVPTTQIAVQNPAKRKADNISEATDAEKAQVEGGVGEAARSPEPQPSCKVKLTSTSPGVLNNTDINDGDRAPKRVRRIAEAARLVALGGAAAGVALFTTLVATAPSFV